MQYMIGIILICVGTWMLVSALNQKKRVLETRMSRENQNLGLETRPTHPSMQMMGDILPPLIRFGLGTLGFMFVILYLVMDESKYFTLFDLAGLLYMLTAYGVWITLTTSYREVEYVVADDAG